MKPGFGPLNHELDGLQGPFHFSFPAYRTSKTVGKPTKMSNALSQSGQLTRVLGMRWVLFCHFSEASDRSEEGSGDTEVGVTGQVQAI